MGSRGRSLESGGGIRGPRGVGSIVQFVPLPHFCEGGSGLPEGENLVGVFAYRSVGSGACLRGWQGGGWIGVYGGLEVGVGGGVGGAEVKWCDVAWLATRVHAGKATRGRAVGVASTSKRRTRETTSTATVGHRPPAPPRPPRGEGRGPHPLACPPPPPLQGPPAWAALQELLLLLLPPPRRHASRLGRMWPVGCSGNNKQTPGGVGAVRGGYLEGLGPAACLVLGGEAGNKDGEGQVAGGEG